MLRLFTCLLLAGPVAVSAQAAVKNCGSLSKIKTAVSAPGSPNTSMSVEYAEVAGTRISFTVGGKGKSCVIVDFAGRMLASLPGSLWLRVSMDGKTLAQPGAVIATSDDAAETAEAHGFTWIFPSVSPGPHSIVVQFKSGSGSAVLVEQNTVVVRYR